MLYIWFWAKSNSPRNMTKTKHALPLQRKGPPLPSLPSLSTGTRMLLLESSIVFSHVSPSPGWLSVALVGARTWEFSGVPTAPGRVLRAHLVPSGCPAWLVLPVNVGLQWSPQWFPVLLGPLTSAKAGEHLERWGKPLPPFWCSLAVQPFSSNILFHKAILAF